MRKKGFQFGRTRCAGSWDKLWRTYRQSENVVMLSCSREGTKEYQLSCFKPRKARGPRDVTKAGVWCPCGRTDKFRLEEPGKPKNYTISHMPKPAKYELQFNAKWLVEGASKEIYKTFENWARDLREMESWALSPCPEWRAPEATPNPAEEYWDRRQRVGNCRIQTAASDLKEWTQPPALKPAEQHRKAGQNTRTPPSSDHRSGLRTSHRAHTSRSLVRNPC